MVWNCTTLFPFPPFGAPGARVAAVAVIIAVKSLPMARNGKSNFSHRHDALPMLNQHAFLI
jgi:hypothetical protein